MDHGVTHYPYQSWCPYCVDGRGREFGHHRVVRESSSTPTVSFDYAFLSNNGDIETQEAPEAAGDRAMIFEPGYRKLPQFCISLIFPDTCSTHFPPRSNPTWICLMCCISAELPKLERVGIASNHSSHHHAFHHPPPDQSTPGSRAKQMMI